MQVVGDGPSAYDAATTGGVDLLVLDLGLPGMDGLEVCRRLRQSGRGIPVLMLTARADEVDFVVGLDAGADDYVAKPFRLAELMARIRALLRRSSPAGRAETLAYEDLVMDLVAHRVARGGHPIHLGPTEYRLLRHFLSHPGRVFSREQLLDAVWGRDVYVEPRTVDVHIRRLRRAINARGEPDLIRTVRAAGYALDSARHAA